MTDLTDAGRAALTLILTADPDLMEIVLRSLLVSGAAVAAACAIGIPLGAALGALRFPGRAPLLVLVNAMMGLPPVVVGLALYLLLSRAGPLGPLGLLYTPAAMILAQTVLVVPIVAALTAQATADLAEEYADLFAALRMRPAARLTTLIHDGRFTLVTAALAGAGRALAEVGAVLIVGGNIDHATRVMTTAIALETSRGALSLALGLGIVLLLLSLIVNGALMALRGAARRHAHG
ncbi:ABC transporter permease [Roseobacter sp. HKCCA0434]|uniref:ABC transporter permease n=1 Tax=Roseobacter sp. HKCCA0434 TaxID=3079297 RepID=UPI002905A4AE|nr:ABC transporter permease [Roseobacter sp. HKCCA0434]